MHRALVGQAAGFDDEVPPRVHACEEEACQKQPFPQLWFPWHARSKACVWARASRDPPCQKENAASSRQSYSRPCCACSPERDELERQLAELNQEVGEAQARAQEVDARATKLQEAVSQLQVG